jgi:hypothetical protein
MIEWLAKNISMLLSSISVLLSRYLQRLSDDKTYLAVNIGAGVVDIEGVTAH